MGEGGKSRREKAASARQQADSSQKRRERTVRVVGAVTVLAVVVAIIGVAVIARNADNASNPNLVQPDPTAPLPAGVLGADSQWAYGVAYGSAPETAPVLELWEDFQCPACGSLEQANGDGIAGLAESGEVRLIWRPTGFLDGNLGNDSSKRAIAAWGCAIDAGKTREFHDVVYANQPEVEGTGWTDEQLIGFGSEAGIAGAELDTFTQCVSDRTYVVWAANATQAFYDGGVGGTPAGILNGVDIGNENLADLELLTQAVKSAQE